MSVKRAAGVRSTIDRFEDAGAPDCRLGQVWTIDVMHQPNWDVTHPYVKGFDPRLGDRVPYQYAWLDK